MLEWGDFLCLNWRDRICAGKAANRCNRCDYANSGGYATLLSMSTRVHKALTAVPVSVALALSMALPATGAVREAHADELSDAQATLSQASAELDSLNKEYDSLQSQLGNLDSQISDTTQKVQDAQAKMLAGRDTLSDAILSQYKSDGALSLVNIVLTSENISDFTKNLTYYSSIQQDQAEKVAEQEQLRDTFSQALSELDGQRDQQQQLIDQADQKKSQAEKVVSDASAKVSSIKEEQAQAQLAALQAQAEEMKKKEEAKQAAAAASSNNTQTSSKWNTDTDRNQTANTNTSSSGNSSSNSGNKNNNSSSSNSGSNSGNSGSSSSSAGWKTGAASAYGGSSDKGTPNPGTTATGAICNDTSMGVAVPLSWPNCRSYLGRAVEIKYGGKTVIATINDLGNMGGGSRALDLQPGVFKAFGFSTCQAWGVRTVSYRIL